MEKVAVVVEQSQIVIEKEHSEIVLSPSFPSNIVITDPGLQGPVGPGVPAGGQVGQLLEKAGTNDYETAWTSKPKFAGFIIETDQKISQNYTLSDNTNGLSVGTIEIEASYTVTVPSGAAWAIV